MPNSCTGQTPTKHSPSFSAVHMEQGSLYFYLLTLATLHGGGHLGFPDEACGPWRPREGVSERQSWANSLITVSGVTSQTESEEPRGARDLTGTLNQDLTGGWRRGHGWRLTAEECNSLPRWVDPPDQIESGSPPSWGSPGPALGPVPLLQTQGRPTDRLAKRGSQQAYDTSWFPSFKKKWDFPFATGLEFLQ